VKASELKVGMLVAIRQREYYGEPAALTVASDTPKAHQRWPGKWIDCADWKDGGVLLSGGPYEMIRKLSQIVPHAEAVAEYQRQRAARDARQAASQRRSTEASALYAELQALAPDGLLVTVSERTLGVTISGSADDMRKLLAACAEVAK